MRVDGFHAGQRGTRPPAHLHPKWSSRPELNRGPLRPGEDPDRSGTVRRSANGAPGSNLDYAETVAFGSRSDLK
jgi:hypothetical protein